MSEFQYTELSEIADLIGGAPFKSSDFQSSGIPVLKIKNVKPNKLLLDEVDYVSSDTAANYPRAKILKNDILITMTGNRYEGGMDSWVGKVARFDEEDRDYYLNQRVGIIRPRDPSLVDVAYLSYCLSSRPMQIRLIKSATGSGGQANLSPNQILGVDVPLPDLGEQQAIAEILSSLDEKIELNRKQNRTLEAIAQALFKRWFVEYEFPDENGRPYKSSGGAMQPSDRSAGEPIWTAESRPEGVSAMDGANQLGEIPVGWEVGTFGDEFEIIMGQSPSGDTYNETGEGAVFFQGRTDFGFRFPSARMYCTDPKKLASKGDILLSVRAPVGDLNIALEDCCIGRGLAAVRSNYRSYAYYKLKYSHPLFQIFETEGTVFGSISKAGFECIESIIPPEVVSQGFNELIKVMDERIETLTQEIRTLTNLRDTLLPKLMSGELRVGDAA